MYSKACALFTRRSAHPKYFVQRFEAMSLHHFPEEAPRPKNRTSCIQNRQLCIYFANPTPLPPPPPRVLGLKS